MRILAVLIYYKGSIPEVNKNIQSFIKYVDRLIIWENSAIYDKDALLINIDPEKVIFKGVGKNVGISKALNKVVFSTKESYDYLLTMDQDSTWINFYDYIEVIKKNRSDRIFAYGPNVVTSENAIVSQMNSIELTDHVITSGALVNFEYLKKLGGYCETLWIDGIDEELCFRARERGFVIQKIYSAFLLQTYGSGKEKVIFGRPIITPAYSAARKYWIVRNHIYLLKKYHLPLKKKKEMVIEYILIPTFCTFAFESDKKNKIIAIIRGVIDGCMWKVA